MALTSQPAWLFSRRADLAVFGGTTALTLALLALAAPLGLLHGESPEWSWVVTVLLVDVAHVWATGFRLLADPAEFRRRRGLFLAVPMVAYVAAALAYQVGEGFFWRLLAYVAVFHFVRQQYGWIALYRARAGGASRRVDRLIDGAAIYLATLYPLVEWHARLPRRFAWFVAGDFVDWPRGAAVLAAFGRPLWAVALIAYGARAIDLYRRGIGQPGKDLVVASTALLWWLGIVALDSDYAFTVTNVLAHGIPYFAIVYFWMRRRGQAPLAHFGWARFLGLLWLLAYCEELLWDKAIWHERPWLFGAPFDLGAARALVVPLLVLPQLTHYLLDGFLWRRRDG